VKEDSSSPCKTLWVVAWKSLLPDLAVIRCLLQLLHLFDQVNSKTIFQRWMPITRFQSAADVNGKIKM